MNKLIMLLCAFMALAHAGDSIIDEIENIRDTCYGVMADYENLVESFKKYNTKMIDEPNSEKKSVNTPEGDVTPLEDLYNFIMHCIKKYRTVVEASQFSINACKSNAYDRLEALLSAVIKITTDLAIYIGRDFEDELAQCGTYANINHTCARAVISKAKNFIAENRKKFDEKFQEAEAQAEANIHKFNYCVNYIDKKSLTECVSLYLQQQKN